jgi:hypothetical protein
MQLYWTKHNKYYKLIEQRTLFGTIDVICIWGRIGGNLGGYKIIPCATAEEVDQIIDQVSARRKYRGYKLDDC